MNISSKPVVSSDELSEDAYVSWHRLVEPRLRAAFVAEFGPELGRDATAEALSYVWENRARVLGVSDQGNPSSAIIENRHGVGVLVDGW